MSAAAWGACRDHPRAGFAKQSRGDRSSPAYVAFARDRLNDLRVRFDVGDARALQASSATFDAVVAGLVLNFIPEPGRAVSEMRVARPGGIVAAYVSDYAEGMQMMRHFWDAAVTGPECSGAR